MKDLRIERPGWNSMPVNPVSGRQNAALDIWFDKYVAPINKLLAEGVEVGLKPNASMIQPFVISENEPIMTGLLVNIQPIKQQSREEKLEECLRQMSARVESVYFPGKSRERLVNEAKALLEKQ